MILQNLHKSVFAQISEDRQFSIPRFFSQLRALQVNWSLKKSFFSQWSHLKRTTRMAKANCIVNLAQPPLPLGLPAICQTCSLIWTRVLWGSQLDSITPSQRLTNISLTDFPLNRPLFLQISLSSQMSPWIGSQREIDLLLSDLRPTIVVRVRPPN